ncbi:MAG: DoxX family protein [Hyphomicrobiales bacterium]|nr:DoxX family protein [Hyphomicrobiales bacterium]
MAMNSNRHYIPALEPLYAKFNDCALPMLRIVTGLILIPHGCQKAFGWFGGAGFARFTQIFDSIGYKPGAVWLSIIIFVELVGGLCLVLGLFTRVAALLVGLFMVNAIWTLWAKGFFWTAGGWEYSLLILAVSLVFMVRGGGSCSLDGKMSREF